MSGDSRRAAAAGTEAHAHDLMTQFAWQQHMQQSYVDNLLYQSEVSRLFYQNMALQMPFLGGYAGALPDQTNMAAQAFGQEPPHSAAPNAYTSARPPQVVGQNGVVPQTWMISNVPVNWGYQGVMQNLHKHGIEKVFHFDCLCMPPKAEPNGRCIAFVNVTKAEANDRLQHFIHGLARDSSGAELDPPLQVKRAKKQGLMFYVEEHPRDSMFFCESSPEGVPTSAFTSVLQSQKQQQQQRQQQQQQSYSLPQPAMQHSHQFPQPGPQVYAPSQPPMQQSYTYPQAAKASPNNSSDVGGEVDAVNLLCRLLEEDEVKPAGKNTLPESSRPQGDHQVRPHLSLVDHVGPHSSEASPPSAERRRERNRSTPKAEAGPTEFNTSIIVMSLHRNTSPTLLLQYFFDQLGIVGGKDIDLLYLPVDFSTNLTKGYAVVNLRDPATARTLIETGKLNVSPDGNEKLATFQWAQIQGAGANAQRFIKRHGHLRNARMRPVVWHEPYASEGLPLKNEDVGKMISNDQNQKPCPYSQNDYQ